MPPPGEVAVGLVGGAFGVHGHLKVTLLTDFPERFQRGTRVRLGGIPRTVEDVFPRTRPQQLCVKLSGIGTRDEASIFVGQLLTVPEEQLTPLPEDTFYRYQLEGLEVVSEDGGRVGRVRQVLATGANEVLVVEVEGGDLLVPLVADFVVEVSPADGRVVVHDVEPLRRATGPPSRGV